MYLNRLNLIGRLVADPEFQKGSTPERDRVWGRIAINRPNSEEADYIPFVCWGATARAVSDHCRKGKVLILDGQLRTRSKEREDGSWDNYSECNCNNVYFGPDAKNTKRTPAPAEDDAQIRPGLDAAMALLAQLAAQAQAAKKSAEPAHPFTGEGNIPL
jgi:single-strand DNA-binding protein